MAFVVGVLGRLQTMQFDAMVRDLDLLLDEEGPVEPGRCAPRGASGDGSHSFEPTSRAHRDGTRGAAPGGREQGTGSREQ